MSETPRYFLGLDLGTSAFKALLLRDDHQVVAVAQAPLQVQHPQTLWSEQNPEDWWDALQAALADLSAQQPQALTQVAGIGLSGQMHGAVLLDDQDRVLRPAILWNDGRSGAECEALTRRVPELAALSGNPAMPGFTAPKLLWVQRHEPEVFARTRRVLLPKDWLRLRLTGEAISDMSDAAGTLWLDTARRDWSEPLLAATGLRRAHMPRLVEGSDIAAQLRPEHAQAWGLPPNTPVAGGAGDNAASAVGMGLVRPGQGFISLGTSGVVFLSGAQFAPNPARAVHAFCHALPGRWHQMSVMLSAASALTWATHQLGFSDEAELLAAAATIGGSRLEQAPLFLPYLSGERSPHNNPLATGAWLDLRDAHTRADLAYAVAEGVGLGLRDGWLSLDDHDQVACLSLVGGGARSATWAQLLADALDVTLTTHVGGATGAALGAARLAWLAIGGEEAAVCHVPAIDQSFTPNPQRHAALRLRHQRFQVLYRRLWA